MVYLGKQEHCSSFSSAFSLSGSISLNDELSFFFTSLGDFTLSLGLVLSSSKLFGMNI